MPSKTEADHIILLLAILEHTEKIEWNAVAKATGLYKDGKFVRQAFNSIKTKYGNEIPVVVTSDGATPKKATATTTTPKSTSKKRAKVTDDADTPSKKSKTEEKEVDN